jgi:hypothetical protein
MEGVVGELCHILLSSGETCQESASSLNAHNCTKADTLDIKQLNMDASAEDQRASHEKQENVSIVTDKPLAHEIADRTLSVSIQGAAENESNSFLTDSGLTDGLQSCNVGTTEQTIADNVNNVSQDESKKDACKDTSGSGEQSSVAENVESLAVSCPPLSDMSLTVPVCPPRFLKVTFKSDQIYLVSSPQYTWLLCGFKCTLWFHAVISQLHQQIHQQKLTQYQDFFKCLFMLSTKLC